MAIIGVKAKPSEQEMQQMATPWLNQKNDFQQGLLPLPLTPQASIGHFTTPRPLMHAPPSLVSSQINGNTGMAPFNGNTNQMQRPTKPLNVPIPQPLMVSASTTVLNPPTGISEF